jgi:hypothetical protein
VTTAVPSPPELNLDSYRVLAEARLEEFLAWHAAGGGPKPAALVPAGAALEMFHAFAAPPAVSSR